MKLFKNKSPFIHQQLFSFISTRRKLNIIKYNCFLNQKLELSQINYKKFFFSQKIKKMKIIHIFVIIDTNFKIILKI